MAKAKKSKKQKLEDAAFIKKISSITVGTGTKLSGHNCPDCGEPMSGYIAVPAIIAVPIHANPPKEKPEKETKAAPDGEVAFSA